MLCLACGGDHVNLGAEVGLRSLECLDRSDLGQHQLGVCPAEIGVTQDAQIGVTQELSAAALPSDGSFSSAVDGRAAEPNAWVQSLKRAQQRCEALAKAAARHRAARGAHRNGTAADRRAFMLPAQALTVSQSPMVSRSPTPEPKQPEEVNRFDALWNNLTRGVPSSPAAMLSFEQQTDQEPLAPSGLMPVLETRDETPEPLQDSTVRLPGSSEEHNNEGEVAALPELASSVTNQSPTPLQEQTLRPIAGTPPAEHIDDVSPVALPELASDPLTSRQTIKEQQQEQTLNLNEPSPGSATSSPPSDVPRSPLLRAMVGLLRTGFRSFDGLYPVDDTGQGSVL